MRERESEWVNETKTKKIKSYQQKIPSSCKKNEQQQEKNDQAKAKDQHWNWKKRL